MKNVTPKLGGGSAKQPKSAEVTDKSLVRLSDSAEDKKKLQVDEATTEALTQVGAIVDTEDERRKTADAKLSSAQNAVGFIVTLAGGSVALAFLQTAVYDLWHGLVISLLTVSVLFFVWAAWKIIQANDPVAYQSRVARSVRRLLDEEKSKQELQRDALNDLIRNVEANIETTNTRMTLYRAAIHNIRKGVIAAGCVPIVVLLAYALNGALGQRLPPLFRIATSGTNLPSALQAVAPIGLKPRPKAAITPMVSSSESRVKIRR